MPAVATKSDALRMTLAGVEVKHLQWIGTIRGVVIERASARCGPGTARLRSRGTAGKQLSFKAPGSTTWGMAVNAVADGSYLLEDGDDPTKWVRVTVYVDYLQPGDEHQVLLGEVFGNAVAHDDVTSQEAEDGDITDYEVTLENAGDESLTNVKVWIDPAVSGLTISNNGLSYWAVTTEATGFPFGTMAPAGTATLYVRRTITASADSDPEVLNHLHASYYGPW